MTKHTKGSINKVLDFKTDQVLKIHDQGKEIKKVKIRSFPTRNMVVLENLDRKSRFYFLYKISISKLRGLLVIPESCLYIYCKEEI